MTTKTYPYETGRFLETEQDIAEFLDAILETGDPATIADGIGIGIAARARGMTQLARDTGLSRESLYRALDRDGNPESRHGHESARSVGRPLEGDGRSLSLLRPRFGAKPAAQRSRRRLRMRLAVAGGCP